MTVEKELKLNFGYIKEQLDKLFDLIDRFDIINTSELLVEHKFSNLKEEDISHKMNEWLKDVDRYFKSYDSDPLVVDGVTSTIHEYNQTLDECERLNAIRHRTDIEQASLDGNIKKLVSIEKAIDDFSKRLEDYFIADINIYLEDIHDTMIANQNNEVICRYLVRLEEALERKQRRIIEIQNFIKENMD